MRVTIIADASYCSQHKVGGFGYWIACERGKRPGGGPLRGSVSNSTVAEMMAICRALHEGITQGLIKKGDDVLIQTDCTPAIGMLQAFNANKMTEETKKVIEVFDKLVKQAELKTSFRHVKGHTKLEEARYAANRACDHRAKVGMRAARRIVQVQS